LIFLKNLKLTKKFIKYFTFFQKSSRLVKRSQFEPDHRAILYNYLQHALGVHGYDNAKRNFDEIDRLSDIDKRYNYGLQNYYDLDKRFDEIDRMGSFTDF
jgi:hypothetical protein